MLNLPLLFLGSFDQQRSQPAVIHPMSIFAVVLVADHFRYDPSDFRGNHTDLVLARVLAIVGDTAQLLDYDQRVRQGLDISLPAA